MKIAVAKYKAIMHCNRCVGQLKNVDQTQCNAETATFIIYKLFNQIATNSSLVNK